MSTDDDLTRDLSAHLADAGADVDVPPGDVDDVVARGRRREAWTRVGAVAAVLVLVGGGGWALADLLLEDPPPTVVIADPAPSASPTPTPTSAPTPSASPTPTPEPEPEPTPTPSATPSPTPEPAVASTPTTTPTPMPSPTPSPEPTPSPTTPAAPAPAASTSTPLVVATDDGVVRIDADGTATPVEGVTGRVDRAWDDGTGGVVVQRADTTIARVVDGRATTIVDLAQHGPRAVDDVTTTDDATVEVEPRRLVLMDVDVVSGDLVYGVEYTAPGGHGPNDATAVVVAGLDGGDRREVALDRTWEGGTHHALGGGVRLANRSSEAGGEITVVDGSDTVATLAYSFLGDGPAPLFGGMLDDTGTRWAAVTPGPDAWMVRTHDVATADLVTEARLADLDAGRPATTTDVVGDTVVVTGTGVDGGGRLSVVHHADGTQVSLPGRATVAR